MVREIFKKLNIVIHTSITRNCTVFLLRRELITLSAISRSHNFYSMKGPTVLVRDV